MSDNYEKGKQDAIAYYSSQAFGGYTRNITPENAIKLFMEPVDEMNVQMPMPLPKPRQDWIRGFREQQLISKTNAP